MVSQTTSSPAVEMYKFIYDFYIDLKFELKCIAMRVKCFILITHNFTNCMNIYRYLSISYLSNNTLNLRQSLSIFFLFYTYTYCTTKHCGRLIKKSRILHLISLIISHTSWSQRTVHKCSTNMDISVHYQSFSCTDST